ncbi:LOW QUALITY PROTEIN: hypothetical protein KUTeg_004503 [Tegillarca granosa]|uniref:Uncharacterized protein n=1 Tax=Tegillarca granosa TaxID=220873 RepID=A0ABQ9FRU9_TEGGR|nr:LOW QUALITY PROTEIN: hypothetical protein KUTeg_004503 [Tegillarca granosa]
MYVNCLNILIILPVSTDVMVEQAQQALSKLLRNYSTEIRPVLNQSNTLYINTRLEFLTINHFEEIIRKFRIRMNVLRWKPEDYGGLQSLTLSPFLLWIPKLTITPVTEITDMFDDENSKLRVSFDGNITFWKPGVIKTTCTPDVTYFPFDIQMCDFRFSLIGYNSQEISLTADSNEISTTHLRMNGMWSKRLLLRVQSTSPFINNQEIPYVLYKFKLERKSQFFTISLVVPAILLCLSIPFVFLLSVESGERISFAMSMFLSFTVFISITYGFMPRRSEPMSFLMVLFTFSFFVSAVIIFATLKVISIYHRDESYPINAIFKYLYRSFGEKCFCSNTHTLDKSTKEVDGQKQLNNGKVLSPSGFQKPKLSIIHSNMFNLIRRYEHFDLRYATRKLVTSQRAPGILLDEVLAVKCICTGCIFMSLCCHVSYCFIHTSIKDTEKVHRDLFTNYISDIRPVLNQSETISVDVDIGIISINTFNELSGILTLTVAFSLGWTDEKLRWLPQRYGNLELITVSPETIWKPAFAMTTLAESTNAFGEETNFKIRVYNNGTVHWWKTGIMKTLCKTKVLYFPFDVQNCFINFVPVGYNAEEVILRTPRKKFHMGFYRGNSLWNFEESYAFSSVFPFTFGGGSNISYCNFHLTIKRKPIFYIMTLILPILIQILIRSVIPIKSGERVSFSMTSFLSFAVFIGMVSNFLPHSTPLPAFIYFLTAALYQ